MAQFISYLKMLPNIIILFLIGYVNKADTKKV